MNRYILLLILLILYFIINNLKLHRSNKRLYLITTFSVFLILDSALRNLAVGSDTYNYYETFNRIKGEPLVWLYRDWINVVGKDPFYSLFQKLFQYVFPYFRCFLFFVAIVFFGGLGHFIYRNVHSMRKIVISYTFYLGLFYGMFSITGIRQTIATGIIFFAYEFLAKKKLLPAFLFTFIAAQFHSSAWIFLIAFIVPYVKINYFKGIILPLSVLLIFAVYLNASYLARYALETLGAEDRYGMYLEENEEKFSVAVFGMYTLIMFGVYVYRKSILKTATMTRFSFMYVIAFLLLATSFIENSAIRISMYYTISMYVLVPELINRIKFPFRYELVFIIMLLLMSFSITEYKFYWQPMHSYAYDITFQQDSFFD